MINKKGFSIGNVDATIFAETPKLSPYRALMCQNIARAIQVDSDRVNIKATTTEGLGIIGKGEGISVACIAVLKRM